MVNRRNAMGHRRTRHSGVTVLLPDTLNEHARTLYATVSQADDRTTIGGIQAPRRGASSIVGTRSGWPERVSRPSPTGGLSAGLDTRSSMITITFDSILSLNEPGA
jgi:hypothetical protein